VSIGLIVQIVMHRIGQTKRQLATKIKEHRETLTKRVVLFQLFLTIDWKIIMNLIGMGQKYWIENRHIQRNWCLRWFL